MRRGNRNCTSFVSASTWLLRIIAVVAVANTPVYSHAQDYIYQTGSPAFSVAQPIPFGFVNLANGNPHIEIPIASAPQRGALGFAAKLVYDSRIWQVVKIHGSLVWKPTNVPNSMGGWRFVTTADPGLVTFDELSGTDCSGGAQKLTGSNFVWQDPEGTRRKFNLTTVQDPGCADDVSSADGYALDSSGYHMYVTGYTNAQVFAKDGTQVSPSVQDTNGNYFSTDSNGNVIDTLGRTLVTKTVNGNQIFYDVLNSQGTTSRFTVTTESIPVRTNFSSSQTGITDDQENITVIASLGLPNGDTYTFNYDAATPSNVGYGLLTSIMHSAMGTIASFGYENFVDAFGVVNRWVTNTADSSISYGAGACVAPATGNCHFVTLTRNGGTVDYTFSMQGGAWNISTVVKSGFNIIVTQAKNFDFSQSCTGCQNPVFVTLQNVRSSVNGLATQTQYTYDSPSSANATLVQRWNYYKGDVTATPPATPDRQAVISYSTDAGLIANHITNRVTSVTQEDGVGNPQSQTKYEYDISTILVKLTGTITDLNAGVSASRGNLTKVSRWIGGTSFLSTLLTYDSSGQLAQVQDPVGNLTKISYTDNFYSDNGANPPSSTTPTQTNAYPTSITTPAGQVTLGYYYDSGKPALATDLNSQTTYQHYLDSLDRVTQIVAPKGWKQMAYSSINFVDIYSGITDTQPSTSCSGCMHEAIGYDNFGYPNLSILDSDPAGPVGVGLVNDIFGNVLLATNPSRTGNAGQTLISYDVLYRPVKTQNPDGSISTVAYSGDVSNAGGAATQSCDSKIYGLADPTMSVDEMGKKRQVWRDAFGRIIEADEPDANSNLNIGTCYQYNLAGQLTQVSQGTLVRSYQYDPLGRPTQVGTPEGGVESYSYINDDGTLCSGDPTDVCKRTDARGIVTRYQYDSSARLTKKSYSDGTPTAVFNYGETAALGVTLSNSVGRPSSVLTQDAKGNTLTGEVFSYDAIGNVINNSQCTPRNCGTGVFQNTYALDELDNVTAFNNSWGRNLTMAFNNAAQLTSVGVSPNDTTHPATVFSSPKYSDFGALTLATLGNGLDEAYGYSKTTGRLVSVRVGSGTPFDVPPPGNVATPGTGSLTISGSVQQTSTTATPATAVLTISGTDRQVSNGTQPATGSSATLAISGLEQFTETIESAGAPGTGTVTINGAEQVFRKQPLRPEVAATSSLALSGTLQSTLTGGHGATPGTGIVTVTGSEVWTTYDPCVARDGSNCPSNYFDYGLVSITVNGIADSASYGEGSTAASVASDLAQAINSDGSAFVNASASNGVLYLTARQAGAASNYSWQLSAVSSDTNGLFDPNGSFANPSSSGTLSNGTDAFAGNTTYDYGTVTISFTTYPSIDPNPKTYTATATYGNGTGQDSSTSAIASDLTAQLTAQGSPVGFSASGFSLQMIAPVGSAGNLLVVNCLSGTKSPFFTTPSFTCPGNTTFKGGISNRTITSYDNGTVSLTVGNYTATANYGYLSSSTNWFSTNLTSASGAQPSSGMISGYAISPTDPEHLFFLQSGHIHHIYTDSNGQWHNQDTTALTNGPTASTGTTAFAGNSTSPNHAFYLDTNSHVHEQYSDSSGGWHDQDITAAANAPVSKYQLLTSFAGAGIYPEHVFYADANSHVHDLYSDWNGHWHDQDATAAAGAPVLSWGLSGFYWINSSTPEHLFYVDSNSHIQELYADASGYWHSQDDIALTGAPTAAAGAILSPLLTYLTCGGTGENVFYQTQSGHIEHIWTDSSGWHQEDVTVAAGATNFPEIPPLSGFCDSNTGRNYVFAVSRGAGQKLVGGPSNWQFSQIGGLGNSLAFFDGLGAHTFFFDNSNLSTANFWETASAGATPANITGQLNAAINAPASLAPVQSTVSGNTLNLVAKKPGLLTNYSLSVTSNYWTALFSQPSFTGTYPATMAGGVDAMQTPLYDSGTVWVSVNSYTDVLPWGLNSTPQSIAADLATRINLDAGSPVTATVAGNVITINSKATGAKTNYTLNAGTTYDSADFTNSSFQIGSNFSTMTGGRDATTGGTVSDTGTITVTVNGIAKQFPYGPTTSSFGPAIASAFNSDPSSPVWACGDCPSSTSVENVTFTARKAGSAGNYPVSVVSATNNSNFTGTSFPASFSGSAMTGGVDSGGSQATITDSGLVSLTIGPFTASVEYGQNNSSNPSAQFVCCTAANLALALGNVINQASSSPVIATVNGGQISLIAKNGGAVTNYALSASSASNDSAHFSTPSFTFSPASGALGGGADKPNLTLGSSSIMAIALSQIGSWQDPNSCDVRLDVIQGSSDYSTCIPPYSASSPFTTTAFASLVAQNINQHSQQNGGSIIASSSGSVIYLQSNTAGSNTNYPVQVVVRLFSTVIPSPISIAVSGPTMSGGTDNPGFTYALDVETDPSGTVSAANDSINGNWIYFYDPLDRLQEALNASNSFTYDYDAYGNRLHQTSVNGHNGLSMVYVNNQLSAPGIQYDASGNVISDGNHTYAYDAENRLISVDGGQTATYLYSADGLRVRSTVGANIYDFIHDSSGASVGVLGANGSLIRQEIGGIATYTPGGAYFHHRDWLGNLRVLTDQAGKIQQTCTNLPYGDALSCNSVVATPTFFTGYMRDFETNLDYANARYYSSQFGRFMSPDPMGGNITDPQSLNAYTYVLNSPLSVIDPSGMDGCVVFDNVGDCVVSTGGGGGGGDGGGPFGGAGGPFSGGLSGIGGGGFGLCTFLNCGFGFGGAVLLPGPPSPTELASEASFSNSFDAGLSAIGSFFTGLGKGAANFFIDVDNGLRQQLNKIGATYEYWSRFEPKNSIEQHTMGWGGAVAAVVISRGRGSRYSGRYADGMPAYRTNVPRDPTGARPLPLEDALGPHSRLQFDARNPGRIYSATEFDQNGMPVRRIDFAGRPGQPVPHEHLWDGLRFDPQHIPIYY